MSDQIIKDDSRFIHGEDLQRNGKWSDVTLTIKSVGDKDSMKAKSGQTIEGHPFHFVETEKVAVFKGCNIRLVKAVLGIQNREQMPGKKITLYPVKGNWFGQEGVCAVRVRVPDGQPRPFITKKDLGQDLTK